MHRLQRIVFASLISFFGMLLHSHFIYFSDYKFNRSYLQEIVLNIEALQNLINFNLFIVNPLEILRFFLIIAELFFFIIIEYLPWFVFFFIFWYLIPLKKNFQGYLTALIAFLCIATYNQVLISSCIYLIFMKKNKLLQYLTSSLAIVLTPVSVSFLNLFRSKYAPFIITLLSILFYIMFWLPDRVDWLFNKSGSIDLIAFNELIYTVSFYIFLICFFAFIFFTKNILYGALLLIFFYLLSGGNFGLAIKYYVWFLFFLILGRDFYSEKNI